MAEQDAGKEDQLEHSTEVLWEKSLFKRRENTAAVIPVFPSKWHNGFTSHEE